MNDYRARQLAAQNPAYRTLSLRTDSILLASYSINDYVVTGSKFY
jgi:hypothetical protein